jgi:lysozyme family protein
MKFDECVKIILAHEGGDKITRDPYDKGGLTKWGISQRAHPDLDIENLTEEQAKQIYKKEYWDFAKCDRLPDYCRLIVFDCAVNQGVARAALFLQRACGTTVDGAIGPKTMAAMAATNPSLFLYLFAMRRHEAYASHPQFSRYGKGWTARLLDVTMKSFHWLNGRAGLT